MWILKIFIIEKQTQVAKTQHPAPKFHLRVEQCWTMYYIQELNDEVLHTYAGHSTSVKLLHEEKKEKEI